MKPWRLALALALVGSAADAQVRLTEWGPVSSVTSGNWSIAASRPGDIIFQCRGDAAGHPGRVFTFKRAGAVVRYLTDRAPHILWSLLCLQRWDT